MEETADSSGLNFTPTSATTALVGDPGSPLGMTIKGLQWRTLRLRSGQALKVRPFKTSVNLTFLAACKAVPLQVFDMLIHARECAAPAHHTPILKLF
jgi:hypothetical protein